jgi:hypothetical protein
MAALNFKPPFFVICGYTPGGQVVPLQCTADGTLIASGKLYPEVDAYTDLPTASSQSGDTFLVRSGSGVWLVNRKPAGLYYSNGSDWEYLSAFPSQHSDANFRIYNNADTTKQISFSLAGITSGQTRQVTIPNSNLTVVGLELNNYFSGLNRFGAAPTTVNFSEFESSGFYKMNGSACAWDDLRVEVESTRSGAVAPATDTGFRGNANMQVINFINTQADEIQFSVQFPHNALPVQTIYPHFHISPFIANAGAAACRFILEYYWADFNTQFPALSSTLALTSTWTGDKQWFHLMATNDTGIAFNKGVSSIMKCRLYRDNTVTNNLAGKVTGLYFDIHYQLDTLGSRTETSK